jgi:hypothetical protein
MEKARECAFIAIAVFGLLVIINTGAIKKRFSVFILPCLGPVNVIHLQALTSGTPGLKDFSNLEKPLPRGGRSSDQIDPYILHHAVFIENHDRIFFAVT